MKHELSKPIESYEPAELPEAPPMDEELGTSEHPAPPMEELSADIHSEPEVATLEFLDPTTVQTELPLQHPFRYDGKVYREITIRRLAISEVGRIAERVTAAGVFDRYEFYSAMTGLPASVIRALPEDDGGALIAKITPFLPRQLQPLLIPTPSPEKAPPSTMRSDSGDDTQ